MEQRVYEKAQAEAARELRRRGYDVPSWYPKKRSYRERKRDKRWRGGKTKRR